MNNLYAKQIAILLTAAVMVAVVILLCVFKLSWPGSDTPPSGPDPYIELVQDETFVEPILDPHPMSHTDVETAPALAEETLDRPSQAAPTSGTAINNAGPVGEPSKVVTTQRTSPVKTTPREQPAKAGAVTENPDPRAAAQRHTNNQVSNAFANAARNNANNRDADNARSGSKTGNANSAGNADSNSARAGVGARSLGGGWMWPAVSNRIKADKTGSVIVEFVVDPSGRVIKADAVGGQAPASTLYGPQCVAIVSALRFTRNDSRVLDHNTTGRITFTFK